MSAKTAPRDASDDGSDGMLTAEDVLVRLRSMANADNVAGMARYGISAEGTLGVTIPALRAIAREVRRERKADPAAAHAIAAELWASGVHEARTLAGFVDVPALVTPEQLERWACDFDSWDVCDQVVSGLFDATPMAWETAEAWAGREETFVKRAGFVLMAALATHDKAAEDAAFAARFLPLIEREAGDDRNFVKKAVNWALRGIGKRSASLNAEAVACAERVAAQGSKPARWIASDALRELRSDAVRRRLGL